MTVRATIKHESDESPFVTFQIRLPSHVPLPRDRRQAATVFPSVLPLLIRQSAQTQSPSSQELHQNVEEHRVPALPVRHSYSAGETN